MSWRRFHQGTRGTEGQMDNLSHGFTHPFLIPLLSLFLFSLPLSPLLASLPLLPPPPLLLLSPLPLFLQLLLSMRLWTGRGPFGRRRLQLLLWEDGRNFGRVGNFIIKYLWFQLLLFWFHIDGQLVECTEKHLHFHYKGHFKRRLKLLSIRHVCSIG